jgi:lysophospholipase L1-like esterase
MKTFTTLSRLALMTLTVLVSTSISEAGQVVVFGDSWAVPFAPALQQVLDGNGYSGINVANAAFDGETASNMASGSLTRGLPYITATLNANPDAQAVHLSIGGNDYLDGWLPSFTPAQDASLFDAIYLDIFTIVNHILSIRPDVEIYHPTYDYLPASTVAGITTSTRANSAFDIMAIEAQTLADSIPQLTFHNSLGLMQVQYGIPGLGIPAFDPSLPDSTLPSPEVAFADAIHLTSAGYLLFAEEAFDVFYEAQIVPEPAALALVGVGLFGMSYFRRMRPQGRKRANCRQKRT